MPSSPDPAVKKSHWFPVPNGLFDPVSGFDAYMRLVLVGLLKHQCKYWQSQEQLAAHLDISRSTLNRALERLEKLGYVTRKPRYWNTTFYQCKTYKDWDEKIQADPSCKLKTGFFRVPDKLYLEGGQKLGHQALLVYLALLRYADNETGQCCPKHKQIGLCTGICVRSVSEALHLLKEAGLVSWQKHPTRLANLYQLHFTPGSDPDFPIPLRKPAQVPRIRRTPQKAASGNVLPVRTDLGLPGDTQLRDVTSALLTAPCSFTFSVPSITQPRDVTNSKEGEPPPEIATLPSKASKAPRSKVGKQAAEFPMPAPLMIPEELSTEISHRDWKIIQLDLSFQMERFGKARIEPYIVQAARMYVGAPGDSGHKSVCMLNWLIRQLDLEAWAISLANRPPELSRPPAAAEEQISVEEKAPQNPPLPAVLQAPSAAKQLDQLEEQYGLKAILAAKKAMPVAIKSQQAPERTQWLATYLEEHCERLTQRDPKADHS